MGIAERPEVRFHLTNSRELQISRAQRRSELLNASTDPEALVDMPLPEARRGMPLPEARTDMPLLEDSGMLLPEAHADMPLPEDAGMLVPEVHAVLPGLAVVEEPARQSDPPASTTISTYVTWFQRILPAAAPAVLFVERILPLQVLQGLPGYLKFGGFALLLLLCGRALPGAWGVLARRGNHIGQKRMSGIPQKRMSGQEPVAGPVFQVLPRQPLPMPGMGDGPRIKGPLAVRRVEAAAAAAAFSENNAVATASEPPRSSFRRGTPSVLSRRA